MPRPVTPKRAVVDGVPAFWAKAPGPFAAGLTFRVGRTDEPLPMAGISHLVEHLTLSGIDHRAVDFNGLVDPTRTMFYASGERPAVAAFLADVCRALAEPAADRVEHERRVLRTEALGHGTSATTWLLMNRYGARGPGTLYYTEFGLRWADADTVRWWAERYFTRGNAVLWLTGEPGDDLRLPLPDGPRRPVPEARPLDFATPGWLPWSDNGVAVSMVARRGAATNVAGGVLQRRLTDRLRRDEGVAYGISANAVLLDPETLHLVLATDVMEEHSDAARALFVATVEQVAADGPDEETLAQTVRAFTDDVPPAPALLDSAAHDELLGREVRTFTRVRRAYEEVTADDVRAAAADLLGSAVYAVPDGSTMPARYAPVPLTSSTRVEGRRLRSRVDEGMTLIVAPDGLTLLDRQGQAATVRYADTVAVLWWEDGARSVVGADGFRILVHPNEWVDAHVALQAIDGGLPRQLFVPMGDAPAGAPPPPLGKAPQLPTHTLAVFAAVCWVLALVMPILVATGPRDPGRPPATTGDVVGTALFLAAIAVGLTGWLVVRRRAENAARQAAD